MWFYYIRRKRVLSCCFRLYLCYYCPRFSCHRAWSVLKNIIHVFYFRSAHHLADLARKQAEFLCDGTRLPLLTTWMVTCEKSVSQTISLNLAYLSWLYSIQQSFYLATWAPISGLARESRVNSSHSWKWLTTDDLVVAYRVLLSEKRKFWVRQWTQLDKLGTDDSIGDLRVCANCSVTSFEEGCWRETRTRWKPLRYRNSSYSAEGNAALLSLKIWAG